MFKIFIVTFTHLQFPAIIIWIDIKKMGLPEYMYCYIQNKYLHQLLILCRCCWFFFQLEQAALVWSHASYRKQSFSRMKMSTYAFFLFSISHKNVVSQMPPQPCYEDDYVGNSDGKNIYICDTQERTPHKKKSHKIAMRLKKQQYTKKWIT